MRFEIFGESERGAVGAFETDQAAAIAQLAEVVFGEGPGSAGFVGAGEELEEGVAAVGLEEPIESAGIGYANGIVGGAGAGAGLAGC